MYNVYAYGINIHLSTLVVKTILWILIISSLFYFAVEMFVTAREKKKNYILVFQFYVQLKFVRTVIENVYKHHLTLLWNALKILAVNRLNILLFRTI